MNDTTLLGKVGKFHIAFRPAKLASHAGVVLLKDFATRIGIEQELDAEVHVKKRERGFTESQFILAAW